MFLDSVLIQMPNNNKASSNAQAHMYPNLIRLLYYYFTLRLAAADGTTPPSYFSSVNIACNYSFCASSQRSL
ncbi:unnamed protein product [Ixodes pacificus]